MLLPLPLPRRRQRALPAVVLVAGLVALAPAAEAQTPPSLTAQSEAQARFQTGLKYYDARDFESARLAFTQAYAVLQKPAILLNLALSELYTNRPLDAANHLDRYLAEPDLPADKRERAKKAYDEAARKVGHLALKVLPGTEVRVDGVAITPPVPPLVHVAPGTRVLDATRGKGTRSVTVTAAAGETLEVDLKIDEGAVGPVAAGVVTKTVTEPPAEPGAGAGVGVGAGVTPPPPVEGERTSSWRTVAGVGGLVFLAGGIASLAIHFKARSDESTARDALDALAPSVPSGDGCARTPSAACTENDRQLRARNDAKALSDVTLVTAIAGGVVGVAGIAAYLFWPKKTSSYAITPGPAPVGASLTATF